MKPNDPYMQGDFLDNKIYVSLNKSHPFWQSFINNNDREYIYLTLVAEEVYVQNQVAKSTSSISVAKLLELRDKAMRDIAIKS